jgi:hypothetical protein
MGSRNLIETTSVSTIALINAIAAPIRSFVNMFRSCLPGPTRKQVAESAEMLPAEKKNTNPALHDAPTHFSWHDKPGNGSLTCHSWAPSACVSIVLDALAC